MIFVCVCVHLRRRQGPCRWSVCVDVTGGRRSVGRGGLPLTDSIDRDVLQPGNGGQLLRKLQKTQCMITAFLKNVTDRCLKKVRPREKNHLGFQNAEGRLDLLDAERYVCEFL